MYILLLLFRCYPPVLLYLTVIVDVEVSISIGNMAENGGAIVLQSGRYYRAQECALFVYSGPDGDKDIIAEEGMGRKAEEREIMTSGTGYDPGTPEGRASLKRLKHYKTSEDGIHCEIDTDRIREIIAEYVDPGYRKETRVSKKSAAEEVFYAPISRPGLRLKLGVGRDTYGAWLMGYAEKEHMAGGGYAANDELADAMREGDDEIARYLAESNESGSSAKSIKLLEAMGEFAPSPGGGGAGAEGGQGGSPLLAGKWADRAE
jgi:hypothetical protein